MSWSAPELGSTVTASGRIAPVLYVVLLQVELQSLAHLLHHGVCEARLGLVPGRGSGITGSRHLPHAAPAAAVAVGERQVASLQSGRLPLRSVDNRPGSVLARPETSLSRRPQSSCRGLCGECGDIGEAGVLPPSSECLLWLFLRGS